MRWDRGTRYRIFSTATLAVFAIAIAVALGSRSSAGRVYDSSMAKPYYSLLPAGAALPSSSECATGCSGDRFEPVPQNAPQNDYMPSASDLTTYKSKASGGEGGAPGSYLIRVDGQFTGT